MSPGIKAKKGKIRADQAMLDRGLAHSLDEARAFIMAGEVLAGDQRIAKASDMIDPDSALRIRNDNRSHYVSRGGDKIAAASAELGLNHIFAGAVVIDVGSSTGGFTDFCLKAGAGHVIAVDVGHNQLAWELRKDSRVTLFESTHIKHLPEEAKAANKTELLANATVMVADVSFNSVARLLPEMLAGAPAAEHFLILVKPQFELEAAMVPAGGVVTNPAHRKLAVENVDHAFRENGFPGGRWIDSPVPGKTGNVEIFYYNRRKGHPAMRARAEERQ
jgi:23S rRNA (cytidine1920-2'-O)/16S rRNA (cytidine1409-2'-O)-methyltransferase